MIHKVGWLSELKPVGCSDQTRRLLPAAYSLAESTLPQNIYAELIPAKKTVAA